MIVGVWTRFANAKLSPSYEVVPGDDLLSEVECKLAEARARLFDERAPAHCEALDTYTAGLVR